MANPNRCMAYVPKNPSDYYCTGNFEVAVRVANAARAAGYKVKESRFRVGPRPKKADDRQRFSYRVTVYWKEGDAKPDMMAFAEAAR